MTWNRSRGTRTDSALESAAAPDTDTSAAARAVQRRSIASCNGVMRLS